jgi:hypothetical protein
MPQPTVNKSFFASFFAKKEALALPFAFSLARKIAGVPRFDRVNRGQKRCQREPAGGSDVPAFV